MNDNDIQRAEVAARAFLMKRIGLWVAVIAFLFGMILTVLMGGNAEHKSALAVFVFKIPLFTIQVTLLTLIALFINWLAGAIRVQKWYDQHHAAIEMATVRKRVGTEDERPGDNAACSWQFMAGTFLISTIILSFYLTQVK